MPVRGLDISNHQGSMDVERVVRDNGIGFVAILTNDGTFRNQYFAAQAAAARRGGATVVPYVYLRPNVAQTIAVHLEVSRGFGSSIVDVEDGSGGVAEIRAAHEQLWAAGRVTPLLYLPQFYWEKIGRPDVSFLGARVAGLWKSWYPDDTARGYDAGLGKVPGYVWGAAISGLPVRMVQFTGTGRLTGYGSNVDLNYFPGSRAELDAILEGNMALTDEDIDRIVNAIKYRVLATTHDTKDANAWVFGGRNIIDILQETLSQAFAAAGRDAEDAKRDAALALAVTDAERRLLDAVRSGPGVDVEELAKLLGPLLPGGATPAQISEALRSVINSTRLNAPEVSVPEQSGA
jgi:hypothetical protein